MDQRDVQLHGRRVRHGLVSAVLGLALAGCGSTVQLRSTATIGQEGLAPSGSTGGELGGTTSGSLAAAATGGSTGSLPGGTSAGTSGAITSGATGTTGGSGGGTGASGSSTTGVAVAGKKDPIRVGVIYTPGADAIFSAAGLGNLSTGDTKAEAEAVVAWIKAHGGLGGHPVTLLSYAYDTSAGSTAAAQQEACTAMVQDLKVHYVVTILANLTVLAPCLAKAGIGLLDDETSLGDKDMASYAAHLGNPGEIAPGRLMNVWVDDLWRRGWLTATSKVGVLADDGNGTHDVVNGPLTAALRRHGLTATKTVYVNPNGGDGGSSASSSAVLTFRSAGVDRVLPVGYSPLFFMQAANSQHYQPAYALVSSFGPGALLESTVPASQLHNAAGVGWQPFLDIGAGTKPGPVSSRETLCFKLMDGYGQRSQSATVKGFQVQVCNVLFYLKDLADRLPSQPRDLLASARPLLGKGFVPADTFRADVTHRTDGVAGYRSLAYQDDCSCFQYVSPVRATP